MVWPFSFSQRSKGLRGLLGLALAALCLGSAACAGSSPAWLVKPHQREYLADRIMRPEANAQENAADQHVLTTREGAVGGGGTVGGGCGCN